MYYAKIQGNKGPVICKGDIKSGVTGFFRGLQSNIRIIFKIESGMEHVIIYETENEVPFKEIFHSTKVIGGE